VDDYPDAQTLPGLVVYRYDAPLCFANAEDFRRRALAAADRGSGPLRWFVLNVEANVEVDFTALEAMEALRDDITGRGATFALARVKQDLLARLEAFGLAGMHDVDDYPDAQTIPGLVVYRYDAPLCFANAEDFRRRALAAANRELDLRWFVLNVEANVEVDFTALEAVDALREDITSRGAVFALARVKQDLLARLEAFGLAGKIGTELLFPTLPTAVQAYQDRTKDPLAGNQGP
jgi:MFS superfamily sulfate permease-like transporter